jgi:hypothetical protein
LNKPAAGAAVEPTSRAPDDHDHVIDEG